MVEVMKPMVVMYPRPPRKVLELLQLLLSTRKP